MAKFDWALRELKKGRIITRSDWNLHGKTYVFILKGEKIGPLLEVPQTLKMRDMIMIVTRSGKIGAWTVAQCDVLAEDWRYADIDKQPTESAKS